MLSQPSVSVTVLLASGLPMAWAQLRLFNITGPVDGLTSTCTQVLNQPIACDPLILELDPGRFHPDDVLSTVCTTTCSNALTTFERRVQGACGTSRYDGGDGWMYLTTFELQVVIETHRELCLRNSQGNFCNNIIRDDVYGADPVDGLVIDRPEPTAFCNNCYLSVLKYRAEQPLGAEDLAETHLGSLTSSCQSTTGFSVTTPSPTTWSTRSSGAPQTPSCEGSEYTIRPGDTCESVSLAQGINTNQLLRSNQLFAYCSNFPSSGSICIPEAWISYAQVVTWNPDIGSYCQNIAALAADGFTICLSNPGGTWVHPFPEDEPDEAEETQTYVSAIDYGVSMTEYGSVPSPTRDALLPNLGHLDPLGNGTRDDCFHYTGSGVVIDSVNSTVSSECGAVADAFGVSEDDLTTWNPDLLATPGHEFPCELRPRFRYCVQDERIRASTITRQCVREAMALPGWACEDFLDLIGLPLARFVEWNPDVGRDCQNWNTGHIYCTSAQGFRPPGQISTCNRWETAERADSDTCGEIAAKHNLQLARFVAWNPSVQQDCSGIVQGYEYCVGTPSFPPPT